MQALGMGKEGFPSQGWEARATVRALNSPDLFPLFFF